MTSTIAARTGLGDLLDRLLDCGVVVAGEVSIGLADIELLILDLRLLLTGVAAADRRGELPPELLHHAPRGVSASPSSPALPARLDLDDERSERGIFGLVLLVVELLHDVIQGQAVARLSTGSLNDDEVERLGIALRRLDERLSALREFVRANGDDRPGGPTDRSFLR